MRIKNKLGKVVLFLMAAMTTVSMSACAKINNETASDICIALKSKYGEDFEVTHIGDRLDKSTATAYVHPADNSSIVFTAKMDRSGGIIDDYINNIILDTVERNLVASLGYNGIVATANAVVTEDDIFETDRDLDPNAFAVKNGLDSILVRVVFDYKNESAEAIIASLEQATAGYDFDLVISMFYMDHDAFSRCESDFKTYPSVGATIIEGYSPLFSVKTILSGGKSSVTSGELATIMEG